MPVAPEGDGARLTTRVRGRRHATPLLILVIAIGVTDVLFAVDSIPAIFGLTRDPFLVFSANLFALLGLRHLYFLIGGLLNRLVYLSAGLAAILAFIGLKLIGEALRAYGVDHLGPVPVPADQRRGVAGGHRRGAARHHREQPGVRPARAGRGPGGAGGPAGPRRPGPRPVAGPGPAAGPRRARG